jgi:hypothetical protein
MKTAKEIAQEAILNKKLIKEDDVTWLESLEFRIKEYAEQACRDQRMICSHVYAFESVSNDGYNLEINGVAIKNIVMEDIENAPTPELK